MLLKDHRDLVAAKLAEPLLAKAENVFAGELDRGGLGDRGALRKEAHHGAGRHGLARAAFADNGDGFALVQLKGHVAHGMHRAALDPEVDGNVAGVENEFPIVFAEIEAFGGGQFCRCSNHFLRSGLVGIDRVAQPVTQGIEREHGDEHEDDRRQDPRIGPDHRKGIGVLQHQAP